MFLPPVVCASRQSHASERSAGRQRDTPVINPRQGIHSIPQTGYFAPAATSLGELGCPLPLMDTSVTIAHVIVNAE